MMRSFFWKVYGVETSIILECPTDYSFYAGQGLVLFMSSLFAFISGCMAGYEASKSWFISFICGCIWGCLIYSIDRIMVSTIDKISLYALPFKKRLAVGFFMYFLPRAVLGFMLAFLMSTPLKLNIFRTQVEMQMSNDKIGDIVTKTNTIRDSIGADKYNADLSVNEKRYRALSDEINTSDTVRNKSLWNDTAEYNKKINGFYVMRLKLRDSVSQYPGSRERFEKKIKDIDYRVALYERRKKETADKIGDNDQQYREDKRQEREQIQQSWQRLNRNVTSKKAIETAAFNTINTSLYRINKDGIDLRLKALFHIRDPFTVFLIWFILTTFWIIEILPTFLKLIGKPRAYEWNVKYREESLIRQFKLKAENDFRVFQDKEDVRITSSVKKYKMENY